MKSINLNVGKLYSCEEYYLLLYPDKETAAAAAAAAAARRRPIGLTLAAYWSKHFGKSVKYVEKNVPLLVLNSEGEYVEVLAGDRKGWIINEAWLNIKEIG